LADASVAICKGVILGIVPDARLLDVSHGVTHYATAEGAALLWAALPHMPVGVHMAVVDPGVGTDRRPLALRTGRGDFLVSRFGSRWRLANCFGEDLVGGLDPVEGR